MGAPYKNQTPTNLGSYVLDVHISRVTGPLGGDSKSPLSLPLLDLDLLSSPPDLVPSSKGREEGEEGIRGWCTRKKRRN